MSQGLNDFGSKSHRISTSWGQYHSWERGGGGGGMMKASHRPVGLNNNNIENTRKYIICIQFKCIIVNPIV